MDRGLPKAHRLTRQTDIDACYRQGRRIAGRLLRVHVRASDLPHPRLGISVPGRLCGAVDRNRWKRLIREAFRLNKAAFGPGLDLVVVPGRPPEGLKRPDVEAALLELARRIRRGA